MINLNNNKIQQIITFFFLNPRKRIYLKQLSDQLDLDNGNLSRYLTSLVNEGFLNAQEEGRQKYFSLNHNYLVLPELKKMMAVKISPEILLKELFSKFSELKAAYIFGSYASGKFNDKNDLDVMLIGEQNPFDIRREIVKLQKQFGREINIIDYTEAEYNKKIKNQDAFLKKVLAEPKIILK